VITPLSEMITFIVALLSALADFIQEPPIFYLFAILLLVFVCRAIRILMDW